MLLGWRIFVQSIRIILSNLGAALRISVLPALIAITFIYFGLQDLIDELDASFAGEGSAGGIAPGQFIGPVLVMVLVGFFFYCWVAVGWHRYILLEEQPGPVSPVWNGPVIFTYILAAFQLALALLLISLLFLFVLLPLMVAVPVQLALLALFAGNCVVSFVAICFSLVLPAAAVGKPIGLQDSFETALAKPGPVLVAMLLVSAFLMLPDLLSSSALSPLIGSLALQIGAGWLGVMIGISFLTTLYGVLVEEREIP